MAEMPGAFMCGAAGAPADALRSIIRLGSCCQGVAYGGPADCTCWEPEFDLEQRPPDRAAVPGTRTQMCADCAFRSDSPERRGDPSYQHSDDEDSLADLDSPFWCHQGMRKPLRWRHPAGITVEATGDYYDPPVIDGVPYRAGGQPGERCAGWAAQQRRNGTAAANVLAEAADG